MKKFILTFSLTGMSLITFADVIMNPPKTISDDSDLLPIGGAIAVVALLFVVYRRTRKQR